MNIKFSYSSVDTYKKCPYKFKLRYLDKIETFPSYNADNPLVIGTAMHAGIKENIKNAVKEYFSNFPVINNEHINEVIKLEYLIPRVKEVLPKGKFEFEINTEIFKGYVDLLTKNSDGSFNIYEFKYTNNIKHYLEDSQLHLYKYFLQKEYNVKVKKLYYIFIPKVNIKQKKDESIGIFRHRFIKTLKDAEIKKIKIDYDYKKVEQFFDCIKKIRTVKDFPKNKGRLCKWCEFKNICFKGEDFMIKTNNNDNNNKKKFIKCMIYGMPYTGKTTFGDTFPSALFINTDGNYRNLKSPYFDLKNEQEPWLLFKEIIKRLKNKGEGRFQTIIIDLIEDLYEFCRQHMYTELGITHEADDGFAAWDKVRWEFLTSLRNLLDLNFNIILISHEDRSREITMKSGEKLTQIKPNIPDKIALKIASMVDIVGRVVADGDIREIHFKTKEEVFGGGRLKIKQNRINLEYKCFIDNIFIN